MVVNYKNRLQVLKLVQPKCYFNYTNKRSTKGEHNHEQIFKQILFKVNHFPSVRSSMPSSLSIKSTKVLTVGFSLFCARI